MDHILKILINYWKPILGLLFIIAGFIIALVKKKPVTDVLSDIYSWSVAAINVTEVDSEYNSNLKGDLKLARASSLVMSWLKNKYPTIEPTKYSKIIVDTIEKLLTTPQKKD